jgi:diadenosine tetraphosphate (Ap4A) HIT family hydrolase
MSSSLPSSTGAADNVIPPTCGVCQENMGYKEIVHGIVWENDTWLLRHCPPPYGIAGWFTLHAKRHVAHAGEFNDTETTTIGPLMKQLCTNVQTITKCEKVYIAGLGESHPHFHLHFVPRYDTNNAYQSTVPSTDGSSPQKTPTTKGWVVFQAGGEAAAGRLTVDGKHVEYIVAEMKKAMQA